MKIKIYIVSFKKMDLLTRLLQSIFDGSNDLSECSVTVMNNYVPVREQPNLDLPPELGRKISVIHNSARPCFSTGHLSRSWNQCIMDGFRDINHPACDAVILAQEDTLFTPNFLTKVIRLLSTLDYITLGTGDEVQVLTPMAIRTIGLFDERFCGTGYQEADYFRRALLTNPERTSINDYPHSRVFNPVEKDILIHVPWGHVRGDPDTKASESQHPISEAVYIHKWGDDYTCWTRGLPKVTPYPKQYMMYPYFEKYLPNLDKKYICH